MLSTLRTAAFSAAVAAVAFTPGNALAHGLATPALRALGRVSYSFYLLHWMIVVLVRYCSPMCLSVSRVGVPPLPLVS